MEEKEILIPVSDLSNIFGEFDANLRLLEDELDVDIITRGDSVKLKGRSDDVSSAGAVLEELCRLSARGSQINETRSSAVLQNFRPRLFQGYSCHIHLPRQQNYGRCAQCR